MLWFYLIVFLHKYLEQHPEDEVHVKLKNFSCLLPSPLQEDNVKERLPGPSHDVNGAYNGMNVH